MPLSGAAAWYSSGSHAESASNSANRGSIAAQASYGEEAPAIAACASATNGRMIGMSRTNSAIRSSSRLLTGSASGVKGSRPVEWAEFTTQDGEALIAGLRAGDGPPVLLLHGGPGLGFDYLCDLAEELAEENDVAWYQQRGQAPSAVEGPYTVATDVEDARRVLDALGWETAYVVGHSFFFSSRRRHTRWTGDWSSDVCSSDLAARSGGDCAHAAVPADDQG